MPKVSSRTDTQAGFRPLPLPAAPFAASLRRCSSAGDLAGQLCAPTSSRDALLHLDGIGVLARPKQTLVVDKRPLLDLPPLPKPSRWARFRRAASNIVPRLRSADCWAEILRRRLIDAHTTVILDIDRTLIRPRAQVYPKDRQLWPAATMPVEPCTAALVKNLQRCGVPVFGLTARGAGHLWEGARRTEKQLARVGIDLTATAPVPDVRNYQWSYLMPRTASRNGIAYSGQEPKGDTFATIYRRHLEGKHKRFVMIDDGIHNFASLLDTAKRLQLDFTCVHYRYDLTDSELAAA